MNAIELKAEYRGYEIDWIDINRTFRIKQNDTEVKSGLRNLEDCQVWIDARLKEKFNRVNAFLIRYNGEVKKGVATSLMPESGDKYYVWLSIANNRRSKENIDSVYLDNEQNSNLLAQMAEKVEQVKAIEAELKSLKEQLEHLTPEMMIQTAKDKTK